jgi:hypothetical protein
MKIYVILLSMVLGTAQAQQQQQKPAGFHIEGHVKGISEKSFVSITDANKPTDTLARGLVKAGMFVLNGHVNEPSLIILNFSSAQKKFSLFIGNETVTINGDIENLSALQVKGSSSEADFMVFEQTFNNYFAQLNQLSQLSNSPDAASRRDSIGQVYQKVAMEIQSRVDNFIQQKKSSYVSPFVLVVVNQLSDDVFLLERRYNSLSPDVQQSVYGSYIREQIDNGKVGAIGTEAMRPDCL